MLDGAATVPPPPDPGWRDRPPINEDPHHLRFEGFDIEYGDGVLEPRPWTALQGDWASELLTHDELPGGPVLELCAGVGHIGLVAVAATTRRLVQVDLSRVACRWARRNAAAAHLAHRVEVRCGDITTAVLPDERFALVIADPPYVPTTSVGLHPEDPQLAIDGGADGLELLEPALEVAEGALLPGGAVLLQARGASQLAELGARVQMTRRSRLSLSEVREVDDVRAVGLWTDRSPS